MGFGAEWRRLVHQWSACSSMLMLMLMLMLMRVPFPSRQFRHLIGGLGPEGEQHL